MLNFLCSFGLRHMQKAANEYLNYPETNTFDVHNDIDDSYEETYGRSIEK
jgi:hypothetical protein